MFIYNINIYIYIPDNTPKEVTEVTEVKSHCYPLQIFLDSFGVFLPKFFSFRTIVNNFKDAGARDSSLSVVEVLLSVFGPSHDLCKSEE